MVGGYQRQDLGGGRVRFVITPGVTGGDSKIPWIAAIGVGILALVVLDFLGVLVWLVAIGGGWFAYQRAKQWSEQHVRSGVPVAVTVSPEELEVSGIMSYRVPRLDIRELVWRDWSSSGNAATSSALYVDTKEESQIITTGLDRQTVTRLAEELSRILGGMPIVGPDQQDGLTVRDAAKKKLEEMRSQYAQDIVTSEMQPMQPGDLVLAEIVSGTFEIQEVTPTGRTSYMNVPHSGYSEIFAFAESNAGGRNLWLTKLSDPGPAVLMKKADA